MALPIISVQNYRPSGLLSKLNITAAVVVKAAPGLLARIIPYIVGTGGNLVINDLTTTTGSAAANQIFTIPQSGLTVGVPIILEWPCLVGIAVTTVPTGGCQFSIAYS